ncbi:LysR family transcriptional regulator [Alkalimonas collagenimarina]|uniref:LysR family transcriptional regulator n=1 Tax=Alkalimonas collagenimarina TaxID=400390 RepID=A0ABT9GVB2_9GAMM|nr:LysR family transcriptional regulator [Alkalimonas collagenimarina]MDP4534992.1 LysR family transcriptional regulator [Alkalimonas collagenimarina]
MDIRHLKYFVAVYEQGSVSAASRQCFIAQPSLSAAIRQLEQQLDVTLFKRLPKGVTPTEDGERLYGHACRLLSQFQALQRSFTEPVDKIRFRLGLVRALGVERMSDLLRQFSVQLPGLELQLVEPDDSCDARIITEELLKSGEQFQPMYHDQFQLALPAGYPLALKPMIELQDFHQLALIKRTPCEAWQRLYPALVRQGIEPDIRADIQTIEYALGLVSAGVACALVPDFEQLRQRQDVLLRPINMTGLTRRIGLAYHPVKTSGVALETLLRLCQKLAA